MVFLPDFALQAILENGLEMIRADLQLGAAGRFYSMLESYNIGRFNLFNEAKALFGRNKGSEKHIAVRRFFDLNRATVPTLHITVPGGTFSQIHGIGNDEDEEMWEDSPIITKSFRASYNIVCTGSSSEEANLLANIIQLYLLGIFDVLETAGFLQTQIGQMDLQSNGVAPEGVMYRAITLQFSYYQEVPSFATIQSAENYIFNGIAKSKI